MLYTTEEFSRIEDFMQRQSEVLQMITQGKSLEAVLEKLISWVEGQASDELIASILCADAEERHLFHCAGAQLPKEYIDAINGLPIAMGSGSCGTAAFIKDSVIVEDTQQSPLWVKHRDLAVKYDLYACWSTPLINHEGKVRGTFAVYYKQPKRPAAADLQLISLVSHTALLAIEQKIAEAERQKAREREAVSTEKVRKCEQRFQNLIRDATIGIVVLRGEDMIVDMVNEMYGRLIGRTPAELMNKPLFTMIPDAEQPFRAMLDDVMRTGKTIYLNDQAYHVVSDGKSIDGYLNLIYQPYREYDGTITGVLAFCQDVTEVVNTRKKLERSEANFRNLVMQAPVAIAVYKGEGLLAEIANDSYLQLLGKTRSEFIGKSLYTTQPELKQLLEPGNNEFKGTEETKFFNEFELSIERNGTLEKCYFNFICKPYYQFEDHTAGCIIVMNEVTAQVNARQQVELREQNVRSIVESAPFPIGVYVGREMRIQFANQSLINVWGKGKDIIGKTYSEVLPELADQHIYEKLDRVFTTGIPYNAKNQRVDLVVDGELKPYYFNYSFTPLYTDDGRIYGVMNTAADITPIRAAFNKLEESEVRARLAIEASDLGTFHINLVTSELVASTRMTEIFDVETDADRNRFVSAIHPHDLGIREQAYDEARDTGILDFEARIIKKDGFVTWIKIKGKFYYDDNGQSTRLVGIVQDITEQKTFAEALSRKVQERTVELVQANKQLHSINDELEQFAYVSSHDLQEPLRKIRVFGDMLSSHIPADGEPGRYLQKIISSTQRMTGLIKGLLEYSSISSAQLRFEPVDLNTLLNTILIDYELMISQKLASVQVGQLPTIEAVPLQMNQLFFNLIGNALKFSRSDVHPIINIHAQTLLPAAKQGFSELDQIKEYTIITVQDNGIGFDQAFAARIFTVFQRLNDRSSYGGYGIGLALCKKVVQAHNGIILAESVVNEGTCFTVILPIKQ